MAPAAGLIGAAAALILLATFVWEAYYLGASNEYTSFQTRREYILVGSSKDPSFDGLK